MLGESARSYEDSKGVQCYHLVGSVSPPVDHLGAMSVQVDIAEVVKFGPKGDFSWTPVIAFRVPRAVLRAFGFDNVKGLSGLLVCQLGSAL